MGTLIAQLVEQNEAVQASMETIRQQQHHEKEESHHGYLDEPDP